jgi:hypothetical protein
MTLRHSPTFGNNHTRLYGFISTVDFVQIDFALHFTLRNAALQLVHIPTPFTSLSLDARNLVQSTEQPFKYYRPPGCEQAIPLHVTVHVDIALLNSLSSTKTLNWPLMDTIVLTLYVGHTAPSMSISQNDKTIYLPRVGWVPSAGQVPRVGRVPRAGIVSNLTNIHART